MNFSNCSEENLLYQPKYFTEWRSEVLYGLAKWKNGLAFKKINFSNNGKPVIKIAELKNGLSAQTKYTRDEFDKSVFLTKGDMVFSWSGNPETSIDIFWYSLPDGWLNQHIFKVTVDNGIDEKFFYYILKFLKPNFTAIASNKQTTGLGHVTIGDLKNIIVKLPELEEQKAIARVLSTLDDKIEVNNQINKTLENMAQAYFDDMFPNVAEGDTTIGEYITPKRGKNLLSKDAISGEVPVIAGGLSPATYHNVSNTQSPVITISASGANAGFVNLWTVPVWSSDSSFIDYGMTKDVYFWYVMLKKRQKEIYDSQTGSAQPHIYPKHITIMPTIKLNVDEINLYTKRVTPLFKKIANNLYEISKLQLIRDTLLPKLMSGEIRVPLDEEGDVS
ncbi:restriction endonuclease subunit S [Enterococcus casseliflavus]|uniref:restriction endonuclease subunit S n=1 Tax=Enterococcus casseliflavus TaxID=37734 RepID=UPI0029537FFA|nr:restriction endonuclease subunit S [Enterococcus casseliflavus]MDV7736846.1 restriction endonuclease subunit S [Enterococcus casseliflavus]